MKKLLTAAMVALATIATSTPAMAHSGDIESLGYPLWNFNFGAQAAGKSYKGPGEVYTSANGAGGVNNIWNFYGGVDGGVTNVNDAQAYDVTFNTAGDISVHAPVTHIASATNLSGYITSTEADPIQITTNVYDFGLNTGHAYVYTAQGQGLTAAELQGIAGVSTATPTVSYTWYEASTGITYDVQEYFVWSSVEDSMSFELTGGSINALQLTPLPPHPIPEPGAVALLGIGGLAGLIMRKRAFFVGEA